MPDTMETMNQTAERMDAMGLSRDQESGLARPIEEFTARLPSDTFLWLATASICGSLALRVMGRRNDALFVGQWVPTFLLFGVYNKIVKVSGHDRTENRAS